MLQEFKQFAMKGNLIDIAVGLVMATAFGIVTTAFVDGVFMPLVGEIFQMGDLSQLKYILSPAVMAADGSITTAESVIKYGSLISSIINFIIIALVMFMIIKSINKMNKETPAAPAGPSQEDLLVEIRDLLSKK